MKAITRDTFVNWARYGGPCASIYLPVHPNGQDRLGDSIALHHATGQARAQLLAMGCSQGLTEQILAPTRDLLDSELWRNRSQAIALLLNAETQLFLTLDLPLQLEVAGDNRFHLRPLIPLLVDSDQFYLLTISENHVQLYAGNSTCLSEVTVPELPANKDAAIQQDDVQREQCATSTIATGTGRRASHFHGQGGRPDSSKSELQEFVTRVVRAVENHLHDEHHPLVLATTDYLASNWKNATHYSNTLYPAIGGCPDRHSRAELHSMAWPVVLQSLRKQHTARFEQLRRGKSNSLVMTSIEQILPAAIAGRVDALMLDASRPLYGDWDESTRTVETYADTGLGDCDLLDYAATETARHGGSIYPCEHTENTEQLCALLRY